MSAPIGLSKAQTDEFVGPRAQAPSKLWIAGVAAQLGKPHLAVFVEPFSDGAVQARAAVGVHLSLQSSALVIAAAWADPFGRHVAGDLTKTMADKLARKSERAPIGQAPAQDEVRVRVVSVPMIFQSRWTRWDTAISIAPLKCAHGWKRSATMHADALPSVALR
jgi:hypothetical protein